MPRPTFSLCLVLWKLVDQFVQAYNEVISLEGDVVDAGLATAEEVLRMASRLTLSQSLFAFVVLPRYP